jgi:hypothetical protein
VIKAIPRARGNKAKAALGVPTCTLMSLQTVFVIDLVQLKVLIKYCKGLTRSLQQRHKSNRIKLQMLKVTMPELNNLLKNLAA